MLGNERAPAIAPVPAFAFGTLGFHFSHSSISRVEGRNGGSDLNNVTKLDKPNRALASKATENGGACLSMIEEYYQQESSLSGCMKWGNIVSSRRSAIIII